MKVKGGICLNGELKTARKAFSRIGLAFSVILLAATALQLVLIIIPRLFWGEDNWLDTSPWGFWLSAFVPLYLVAIPLGLLILRKLPAQTPQDHPLGGKNAFVIFTISLCVMYTGNIIGTALSMILSGGTAQNAVVEYASDTNPLKVLFVVILAPTIEEYVCRKQIIDRTRQYGEKTAVFLSGLVFGLLHQNFFQFFYAFGLGLIFGYVYIRTGRLRYTILLHGIINFMGGVIAPWIVSLMDAQALNSLTPDASPEEVLAVYDKILPGMLLSSLYALFLIGMSITGLVLLILKCRKLIWKVGDTQLPAGIAVKTVYWNVGMVLYVLLCAASMVLALM